MMLDPPLAELGPESITAIGLGVTGLITGVGGMVVALRKAKSEEGRRDSAEVFKQQQTIINSLNRRIDRLDESYGELIKSNKVLTADNEKLRSDLIRSEQDRIVQRERIDYLERELVKLKALYTTCTVADCPMAAAIKGKIL